MPDHKAIPDAELHEPKGVAGATSGDVYEADGLGSGSWNVPATHEPKGVDTALIRQVYTADGLGSGDWSDTVISTHGEMSITNNATATSVTAAADATLNTDSDYTKITAGWAAGHLQNITFNIDKLVAPVTGDYKVTFWAAIKIPLNNNFVGIKYAIDDNTPYSLQKLVSQSATTSDYRNMFGSAMVTLTAGQTVSIYIAATKTDSLVVEESGCQLELIHT